MLVECVPTIIRTRRQYPAAPPFGFFSSVLLVMRGAFFVGFSMMAVVDEGGFAQSVYVFFTS